MGERNVAKRIDAVLCGSSSMSHLSRNAGVAPPRPWHPQGAWPHPALRGRFFWRAPAHRVGAGVERCGGGGGGGRPPPPPPTPPPPRARGGARGGRGRG